MFPLQDLHEPAAVLRGRVDERVAHLEHGELRLFVRQMCEHEYWKLQSGNFEAREFEKLDDLNVKFLKTQSNITRFSSAESNCISQEEPTQGLPVCLV